jgi:hypothetical protein
MVCVAISNIKEKETEPLQQKVSEPHLCDEVIVALRIEP